MKATPPAMPPGVNAAYRLGSGRFRHVPVPRLAPRASIFLGRAERSCCPCLRLLVGPADCHGQTLAPHTSPGRKPGDCGNEGHPAYHAAGVGVAYRLGSGRFRHVPVPRLAPRASIFLGRAERECRHGFARPAPSGRPPENPGGSAKDHRRPWPVASLLHGSATISLFQADALPL